jgi:four helix bundle protein
MRGARVLCMRAKCLEELLVYQKAVVACDEVSAYLKRPSFEDNRRLRDQLGASSERVGSLISEGFGQGTDKHFASYLFIARGSSKETRNQLRVATTRGHITVSERDKTSERYHEIERMLTSLANYLRRSNRRRR